MQHDTTSSQPFAKLPVSRSLFVKPILFSTPMVKAIMEGRKTQTRRTVKGLALDWLQPGMFTPEYVALPENNMCPYGGKGDMLWVKETFTVIDYWETQKSVQVMYEDAATLVCNLTDLEWSKFDKWQNKTERKPSLFMFKSMSRNWLTIGDRKIELLQDISEDDAFCEGCEAAPLPDLGNTFKTYKQGFEYLWININGQESWNKNPFVWAVDFERSERPQGFC